MIGMAGLGFLSSLLMKELPMQRAVDESWGLNEGGEGKIADGTAAEGKTAETAAPSA